MTTNVIVSPGPKKSSRSPEMFAYMYVKNEKSIQLNVFRLIVTSYFPVIPTFENISILN